LTRADGPTSIAKWAEMKKELLTRLLPLPHGIPRKDVFRRVLSTLKPAAFQACFAEWLKSLRDAAAQASGVTQPILAIDGKTVRRSHDRKKGLGALHSVSVWASDFGLTLAQVATDEKSNEITAIPEVLKLVDIQGAIITIDAMGAQTAIAKQIIDGKGDYVLALKRNQETLHQGVMDYLDEQLENNCAEVDARQQVTTEKGHGREETRVYIQMPVPKNLPGLDRWTGLKTIGVVFLASVRNGKPTTKRRYYISSLPLGVQQFAHAVRAHWGIENTCHWSLDINYREDESRIRQKHMRENFAWLNRFTLSLLKQHPGKDSLIMKRRCCSWNDDFLMEILNTITV
jgi:predicted transposase YbfD/YdcC